jgi:hypothetical protein
MRFFFTGLSIGVVYIILSIGIEIDHIIWIFILHFVVGMSFVLFML